MTSWQSNQGGQWRATSQRNEHGSLRTSSMSGRSSARVGSGMGIGAVGMDERHHRRSPEHPRYRRQHHDRFADRLTRSRTGRNRLGPAPPCTRFSILEMKPCCGSENTASARTWRWVTLRGCDLETCACIDSSRADCPPHAAAVGRSHQPSAGAGAVAANSIAVSFSASLKASKDPGQGDTRAQLQRGCRSQPPVVVPTCPVCGGCRLPGKRVELQCRPTPGRIGSSACHTPRFVRVRTGLRTMRPTNSNVLLALMDSSASFKWFFFILSVQKHSIQSSAKCLFDKPIFQFVLLTLVILPPKVQSSAKKWVKVQI